MTSSSVLYPSLSSIRKSSTIRDSIIKSPNLINWGLYKALAGSGDKTFSTNNPIDIDVAVSLIRPSVLENLLVKKPNTSLSISSNLKSLLIQPTLRKYLTASLRLLLASLTFSSITCASVASLLFICIFL